jgi:hypothetical protein
MGRREMRLNRKPSLGSNEEEVEVVMRSLHSTAFMSMMVRPGGVLM